MVMLQHFTVLGLSALLWSAVFSDDCCKYKRVDGIDYTLVDVDADQTQEFDCKDGCIYNKYGDTIGLQYCFKKGGMGGKPVTECIQGGPTIPLPTLVKSGYSEKGEVLNVGDLSLYVVGTGDRVIIFNYDINGFEGGNTRQMCDILADQGYLVILPDYFRGVPKTEAENFADFVGRTTNWTNLKSDWEERIKPFAEGKGATSFGAVGTCWGSYMVVKLSSYPEFKAGASWHPSHPGLIMFKEENLNDTLAEVQCPQLMLLSDREVGKFQKDKDALGDKLTLVDFPTMPHGFTVSGNLSDPEVEKEVLRALKLTFVFMEQNFS